MAVKFVPNEEAKANPRHYNLNGKKVGVGGTVVVKRTPPKIPVTYKEATAAQYKELYDLGFKHLIKKVETEGKVTFKKEAKNKKLHNERKAKDSNSKTGGQPEAVRPLQ